MFTGMYPWEHGATQRNLELDVEKELLAERFSEEGYTTACFSINGFLRDHSGLIEGFDTVENLAFGGLGLIDKITQYAEQWLSGEKGFIRSRVARIGDSIFHYRNSEMRETEDVLERGRAFIEDSEDFFVFMNLMDAHEPYYPPEEYRKRHIKKDSICQDPSDFYRGQEVDFEEVHRHYNASVDYMDDQLGEFFEFLKEEGFWEDTVIVLTADHGQMLGEEDQYGHQYSVHEKLVSVPLIVKGSGEDPGLMELRELYDLLPSWANLEEKDESGTEVAKGGYEFPDMMINRIPEKERDRLYRRQKFARTSERKAVETEDERGEKNREVVELKTGESVSDSELEKELEAIVYSGEEGSGIDDKEEEVKEKLEALGYG